MLAGEGDEKVNAEYMRFRSGVEKTLAADVEAAGDAEASSFCAVGGGVTGRSAFSEAASTAAYIGDTR